MTERFCGFAGIIGFGYETEPIQRRFSPQKLRWMGGGRERNIIAPLDATFVVADSLGLNDLKVKFHHYARLNSTQTKAEELAKLGAPEGTVVLATMQLAGRGRWGRAWLSPRGGLWVSMVLRPKLSAHHVQLLGLAMALSIVNALTKRFGLKAGIRWPNDVIVKEKKIAGILVEASFEGDRVEHVILGLGVNVNNQLDQFPRSLRPRVTSVSLELRKKVASKPLLETILSEFESRYRQVANGTQRLQHEIRNHTVTLGRRVRVQQPDSTLEGEAVDLDSAGGLILRFMDGSTRCFYAGEVFHLEQ